ncbi:MAG: amidase domain-containing protein [Bacillota bacterium]
MSSVFNVKPYNRQAAVDYALKWALQNNPQYYDFSSIGGDCTNFASQTVYAGSGVMNYTPVYGWYYINANDKSPSWTGVNFFYQFLMNNRGKGPFAREVGIEGIQPGDIIQLSFENSRIFQHSLVVTKITGPNNPANIWISTHSPQAKNAGLTSYTWVAIRFVHITGVNL